jgi:probable rRNA maturation factor
MTSARKPAEPAPRLSLAVQYAVHDPGLPSRPQVRRWVSACKPGAARVTVRFVDTEQGRELNARYRGRDYATNVLSFPYAPPPALEGDLAVCAEVVQREAQEQGKAPEAHFAHLIVHGMLHLQGFEHDNDSDAARMEEREIAILARLGYQNPYEDRQDSGSGIRDSAGHRAATPNPES